MLYLISGSLLLREFQISTEYNVMYSGTPLSGHPSTMDTCDITDNSECPDCISIDFNTFKPPQQQTPHYSV